MAKYSAIVLRNIQNPVSSVEYEAVVSALLSGGVFLDELVFLPYNAPSLLSEAFARLSQSYDAVILIADGVLLHGAKEAASMEAGRNFTEEYVLETESCMFIVLPDGERGAELVKNEIMPRIDRRRRNSYARVIIRTMHAPTELIQHAIQRATAVAMGKLTIHAQEKYGGVRIEVIYDSVTPKMTADEVVRIFATELSDYIYALEDVSLASRLVDALKLHRLRVSTAESFTGGGVGREIVRIPGASEVFFEGLNTYDNQSKKERLGVAESTLKQKGAVSDETAYEMAASLISQGHCDLAISTTGIAGPTSDYSEKPIGLCFIGIGTKQRVRVYRFQLAGDRETITETAINLALFCAYKEVK